MASLVNTVAKDLDRRIEAAGWGLFFLMSGVVLLLPDLPDGTWLTGTGAIIVGFAALRANLGVPASPFWTVLGGGFAVLGVATLVGLALPWVATLTMACGFGLVAEVLVGRSAQA